MTKLDNYGFVCYADAMKRSAFIKPAFITVSVLVAVLLAIVMQNGIKNLQDAEVLRDKMSTASTDVPKPPSPSELLELVNAERTKVGVAPLVMRAELNGSAQIKADDMWKNQYNSHVDATGKHGYMYAYEALPDMCQMPSENVYWGDSEEFPNTSSGAIKGWMLSKPHHDAMLNGKYTITGFGIAGTKVVEHFC